MSNSPTWNEIVPPPASVSNPVTAALETLEPLKHAWEEAAIADPDGFRVDAPSHSSITRDRDRNH